VRNTSLDGKPLTGDGEVFTGERPLDVVMAMKGAALFSDHGNVAEYVDMVLRNAKMLAGIELTVSGDGPEALAESLLASLGSSMDNFSEADENQGTASSMPATGQASNKTSVSTLNAGIGLRQGQGTEKGSVETGAVAKMPFAGGQTEGLAAEPASVVAKPASARTEEKKTATEPETESARNSRPARSINATKPDAVSAAPLPGLVPAATASLSQTAPVAVFVNLATNSMGERAQMVQTENSAALLTHQPDTFASASYCFLNPVSVCARLKSSAFLVLETLYFGSLSSSDLVSFSLFILAFSVASSALIAANV